MAREVEGMKWDIRERVETRDPTERVLDVKLWDKVCRSRIWHDYLVGKN